MLPLNNYYFKLQGKSSGGGFTPSGTLEITKNGAYNVTNYAAANVNVPTGTPIELATSAEMDAVLVSANVGKIYKYVGETNETYANGNLYQVTEEA